MNEFILTTGKEVSLCQVLIEPDHGETAPEAGGAPDTAGAPAPEDPIPPVAAGEAFPREEVSAAAAELAAVAADTVFFVAPAGGRDIMKRALPIPVNKPKKKN
jgi:hypothetical protein